MVECHIIKTASIERAGRREGPGLIVSGGFGLPVVIGKRSHRLRTTPKKWAESKEGGSRVCHMPHDVMLRHMILCAFLAALTRRQANLKTR
jgi:hypothetical protein